MRKRFPFPRIFLPCLLLLLMTDASARCEEAPFFPVPPPLRKGYLAVSQRHRLYYEVRGTEQGIPVIVLHGGPGGRAGPGMARFFDPKRFKVVLFDQRGAGRSLPKAEWRENSTPLLVEDIEKIRKETGVTGKAILFGGSWGTTLALAYAEAHPYHVGGLVLRGVFLGTRAEIDHFYHGGTALFFPENFARLQRLLAHPERKDYPRQLFEATQSPDPAVRTRAIKGWAYYELRMAYLDMTDEKCASWIEGADVTAFSVLENHYMMHGCFLEEGQLLAGTDRIAEIPAFIVNGRFDVICPPSAAHRLANKLKEVRLVFTPAAHGQDEPPTAAALLDGVRWVADRFRAE